MLSCPKFRLSKGPHSPFAAGLRRSQSGMKFWFVSFHVRLTLFTDVLIGLFALGIVVAVISTYRPTDTFRAVCPLPNRSYDTPRRGFRSVHEGTSCTGPKLRAGPNLPSGADWAGTYPLK